MFLKTFIVLLCLCYVWFLKYYALIGLVTALRYGEVSATSIWLNTVSILLLFKMQQTLIMYLYWLGHNSAVITVFTFVSSFKIVYHNNTIICLIWLYLCHFKIKSNKNILSLIYLIIWLFVLIGHLKLKLWGMYQKMTLLFL